MPREDTYHVNPYLYLLLKEMFSYEVGFIYNKVTDLNACRYYVLSLKSFETVEALKAYAKKQMANNAFPDGSSTFKRHVWNNVNDFLFTDYRLDLMARSIRFLGDFKSWEDFKKQYNYGPCAYFAEFYKRKSYKQLADENILEGLHGEVYETLGTLIRGATTSGKFKGRTYNLIGSLYGGYLIRTADLEDEKTFEQLRKIRQEPNEILNRQYLPNYRQSLIVLTNFYDNVYGYCMFVPSKNDFYAKLRLGLSELHDFKINDFDDFPIPSNILMAELTVACKGFEVILSRHLHHVLAMLNNVLPKRDGEIHPGEFANLSISVSCENKEKYHFLTKNGFNPMKNKNILSRKYDFVIY